MRESVASSFGSARRDSVACGQARRSASLARRRPSPTIGRPRVTSLVGSRRLSALGSSSVGDRDLTRPQKGSDSGHGKPCTQVSGSPRGGGLQERGSKRAVALHELLPKTLNGRMAPGRGRALRSRRPALRVLVANALCAHDLPIRQASLLLDCEDTVVQEPANHAESVEPTNRQGRQPELFRFGPALVEPGTPPRGRCAPAASRSAQVSGPVRTKSSAISTAPADSPPRFPPPRSRRT